MAYRFVSVCAINETATTANTKTAKHFRCSFLTEKIIKINSVVTLLINSVLTQQLAERKGNCQATKLFLQTSTARASVA